MSASLTRHEIEIVAALRNSGISLPAATLAVVMITREHARPESELADIIRQYQNLEDRHTAEQAIAELKRIGWLAESESYGQYLVHQAPDLRDKLAEKLQDSSLPQRLSEMRSTLEENVRIVGPMKERYVYESFLDLLREAQREICLPMLATSPRLSSVPILQERARRGVHLRVLLGSPEVVAKLRGEPMRAMARDAISGWLENARGIPSMEIRIAHFAEDMLIATCMTIDSCVLRFDIYDPLNQRSLEGVMLHVESPSGLTLNMVSLFQQFFDGAWRRAEHTGRFGKLKWWFSTGWQWWLFLGFSALAIVFYPDVWSGIFGSAAATFLVNALVTSGPKIRSLIRDLL